MAFDLKAALTSFAPTLATMLGGPLAGTAVTALEGAFGLTPGAGQEEITKVMQSGNMTPEVIAAVRAADQKHAEILAQQQIDVQKMNLDYEAAIIKADTDNVMNARTSNVQGGTQLYLFFLSLILLGISLGCEGYVLFHGVPDTVHDIVVGRVLGLMDAVAMMVLSYWYGTTHGSGLKTGMMANMVQAGQK
jgi:hypothetical protein